MHKEETGLDFIQSNSKKAVFGAFTSCLIEESQLTINLHAISSFLVAAAGSASETPSA